jgi:hypothetical protein
LNESPSLSAFRGGTIWSMYEQIDAFLERYPRLAEPSGADNQCRLATDELVGALEAKGIEATPVWVRGHRREPEKPAPRAMGADRHRLVRLADGSFVDVTRRQFDPQAEHPTYYASEVELAGQWQQIDRGPPNGPAADEDWRSLDSHPG